MKIPQKINIGGIIFNIEQVDKIDNSLHGLDYFGVINQETCTIQLAGQLNEQRKMQTFIHEILHGIACNYAVELKEEDIERLSNGILQVLKDNNFLKD